MLRAEALVMERIARLDPHSVVRYLERSGWTLSGGTDRAATLRCTRKGEYEGALVRVPLVRSLADYRMRMREVLETAAQVESRYLEDILDALDGDGELLVAVVVAEGGSPEELKAHLSEAIEGHGHHVVTVEAGKAAGRSEACALARKLARQLVTCGDGKRQDILDVAGAWKDHPELIEALRALRDEE